MGCGQCTNAKQRQLPTLTGADKTYEIGKAFCMRELRILPSREKYRKRLQKWNKMHLTYKLADFPLNRFRAEKTEIFQRRLEKGPPVEYRWRAWLAAADYQGDTNLFTQLMYGELSQQVEEDIDKDITRTFPDHAYLAGEKGRATLKRVLKAFALHNQDIGYCQGLNYIAAFLLLVSGGSDSECFFLFNFVVRTYHLKGFYVSRFPGLWKMIEQFNCVLGKRSPQLAAHLRQESAHEMSWVGPWMLSLYTTAVPFAVVVRIWDLMLAQGPEVLIKAAVRLVDFAKKKLLAGDLGAIVDTFATLRIAPMPIDEFVRETLRVDLDPQLLEAGAKHYEDNLTDSARNSLAAQLAPVFQGNEKCAPLP